MTTPPRPETIDKLGNAVYSSFAMLAGMQLCLFTPLGDGTMSAEQLATALGVGPAKLRPLLYALVAAGLLTVEGDLFSNTPEADHFLVRGKPAYLGESHRAIMGRWNAILKTAETIRTGTPQDKVDFSSITEDESEILARGRKAETTATARDLLRRYDFSAYRSLVDVGGGAGYLSIAITEACPNLRATVVDLPAATAIAKRVVEEEGAMERVQVTTADVVSGPLVGSFDVAVLRAFIQVLAPDQAWSAMRNVSRVIEPGGAIYVVGAILDNSRLTPSEILGMNLFFLNRFETGQTYTEQEHRDWLTEAGFQDFERVVLPNGASIVTARKPS